VGQSWDIGRFIKTLVYFDSIPPIRCIKSMFFSTPPLPPPLPLANLLFDFRQSNMAINQIWGVLDDVVMGGASASQIQQSSSGLVFKGVVSTANSGGFASVRTRNFQPPLNLSQFRGLSLHLQGDGNRYKFLIRDENTWDSLAYSYSFSTTAQEWATVRIPFDQLIPVFRAKTVKTAAPLDTSRIQSLQLMLSKFEYDGNLNPQFTPGQFQLLLESIHLY